MKIARMCGGRLKVRRYGWRKPRIAAGALIIDNLGIAIVYKRGQGW